MSKFSNTSAQRLGTCHEDLQAVMNTAIKKVDFTILCGHRNQADQDKAFTEGHSKLKWPHGEHNALPSNAVDISPYPLDWNDRKSFIDLSKVILGVADDLGIKLRWGGDFNMDGDKTTNDGWDPGHYEIHNA